MNNSFFALIFRQKYIKRWGLMRNVNDENLAEHAAEVAMITHALATIGNTQLGKNYDVGKAVSAGLFHDVSEVYTGDLPTPIKYSSPELRNRYKDIEKSATQTLLMHLPENMREEYAKTMEPEDKEIKTLVKAADKLCAYIKCIEEEKCSNMEFKEAKKATYAALLDTDCPELKIFMDTYLDSFALTLDEMQK